MELKRNVAWVRRSKPLFWADGTFGKSTTMNPCPIVKDDTIYLFYAADDNSDRRQVRLATAPVSDPENFTYRGVMIKNSDTYGAFDYAWCVLPHVVQLPDGTYYMLYSGNRGYGESSLACFPGLGCAWSKDLLTWEKYENNPVLPSNGKEDYPIVGIAGGGLFCENLGNGNYKLHLYYTACPSSGGNIFLDQQKSCNYATSTDGINWVRHGVVHRRTTARDYENIAATGGPVIRNADGMLQHWYSAIGTRWGVYSIAYAESYDGFNWAQGDRYGENLSLAPEVRDIGNLHFVPWKQRWQDQSVSYPGIVQIGDSLRLYYCGNDYGEGGIGTAVAAPMRIALTGETRGEAKLWIRGDDTLYRMQLSSAVSTAQTGVLAPGKHEEGITHNASVFYEEFPEQDGKALFSLRTALVHTEEGIRFDLFAENVGNVDYDDLCVTVNVGNAPVTVTAKNSEVIREENGFTVRLGKLAAKTTICTYAYIKK
jgi:hypothetical protein